jgi:hypothetical protein
VCVLAIRVRVPGQRRVRGRPRAPISWRHVALALGLLPRGLTGPANVKRDGVLCGPAIPGHLGIWPIHPRDGDFSFPLSPSPFPRPLLLGAPSPFPPPWRRVRHGVGGAPRQGAWPVEVVAGVAPCDYCSWLCSVATPAISCIIGAFCPRRVQKWPSWVRLCWDLCPVASYGLAE